MASGMYNETGTGVPVEMRMAESGESMDDGFTGPNPYHHSEMPMMHLQGDKGPVFVQPVMDMSENFMNDRPQSSTDMIAWDSTSLAKGPEHGGDTQNRSSDSNGYRTPPVQSSTHA